MTLQSSRSLEDRLSVIGLEIEDVDEETYDLFSSTLPQSSLGMINDKATTLQIDVAGHQYEIRQSPGLLTSSNAEGTTGAALWKISPVVAEWLVDKTNVLWSNRILRPDVNALELGCGITGLIGCVLARHVAKYVLTDQRSVLKLLQENVDANKPMSAAIKGRAPKKGSVADCPSNIDVVELNWETDDVRLLDQVLPPAQPVDVIIVCDCVFNDFLLQPLTRTCESIARQYAATPTVILFAQQLRSDEVFSAFLEILLTKFRIWRLPENILPASLHRGTGFVLHLAVLR